MKLEYLEEWGDDQPQPGEEETLPVWARKEGGRPAEDTVCSLEQPEAEAADVSIEDDDLDWIQLDNGWQLVIWDEEDWAEMGLSLAGFARIIDRLQAATAGSLEGEATLAQREIEAALANGANAPSRPRIVS